MKDQQTPDQVLESLYTSYQDEGLHDAEKMLWWMLCQSIKLDHQGNPGTSLKTQEALEALVVNLTSLMDYARKRYGKE